MDSEHSLLPERSQGSVSLEALRAFLMQADQHAGAPRRKTLFSIGGRGYYENATSNLLAFFLAPQEDHGLGPLFLRTFFDCMGAEVTNHDLVRGVSVSREERLEDGKRLDLLVRGSGWALAIENKIRHTPNNDFDAYAIQTQRAAGLAGRAYLALLTVRDTDQVNGWTTVTYRAYCTALTQALAKPPLVSTPSRWPVLAQEFVTHLIQELYPTAMNPSTEQNALLEAHLREFGILQEIFEGYMPALVARLSERLQRAVPGQVFPYLPKASWAIVWEEEAGNWCFFLQTPAQASGNPERRFRAGVWLRDQALLEERRRLGRVHN